MGQLVITVHKDGMLETLLNDKVFDTRVFGNREIKRITLIEFDAARQKFYIKWLRGPYMNHIHDTYHAANILGKKPPHDIETAYFDTYEEAVQHEIACVNKLRLQGCSFA